MEGVVPVVLIAVADRGIGDVVSVIVLAAAGRGMGGVVPVVVLAGIELVGQSFGLKNT
jgi:hypothetical protein